MELLILNNNNQPSKLVENYDSLIWAERFNTVGDFQLKAGNVEYFLNLLPEGKRITLYDSNVVMEVETHDIERPKNKPQSVTIKGRAYESILDRRVSIQSVGSLTGSDNWEVAAKTPSDVAWYIMDAICVDGLISAADIFPSSSVLMPPPADYLASSGPTKNFTVERGNLLKTVLDLLQTEAEEDVSTTPVTPKVVPHGIRSKRPSSTYPTTSITAITLEIYKGTDVSDSVYFDATRDLLDDGRYLFSKVGSANAAYGVASGLAATMYEGASEPTGLDRRVMLVDASTSGIASQEVLKNEMSRALSSARETAMFDGSVNQDLNPYIYGYDYDLGDIVRVQGDYGLETKARVTEYIRTQDATGDKAYPTLSAVAE